MYYPDILNKFRKYSTIIEAQFCMYFTVIFAENVNGLHKASDTADCPLLPVNPAFPLSGRISGNIQNNDITL